MELVCGSIVTLLILYVLYSECIKLPKLIKQNKKLAYVATIGLYLYWYQNRVEGFGWGDLGLFVLGVICLIAAAVLLLAAVYTVYGVIKDRKEGKDEDGGWPLMVMCFSLIAAAATAAGITFILTSLGKLGP
tara:strand:- start:1453 stop:1848 length:396 start_codon:yes stop_codon:yes gene_type:complete